MLVEEVTTRDRAGRPDRAAPGSTVVLRVGWDVGLGAPRRTRAPSTHAPSSTDTSRSGERALPYSRPPARRGRRLPLGPTAHWGQGRCFRGWRASQPTGRLDDPRGTSTRKMTMPPTARRQAPQRRERGACPGAARAALGRRHVAADHRRPQAAVPGAGLRRHQEHLPVPAAAGRLRPLREADVRRRAWEGERRRPVHVMHRRPRAPRVRDDRGVSAGGEQPSRRGRRSPACSRDRRRPGHPRPQRVAP